MKIIHLYAKNLEIFNGLLEGTECRLNASTDINDLFKTLYNFNARDVLGLIIFANPFTTKCVKLIKAFDDFFVFKTMPIIIISDNASSLVKNTLKVKNSMLIPLDSEENSISDVEVEKILATLIIHGCEIYDLSVLDKSLKEDKNNKESKNSLELSDNLKELLYENYYKRPAES